MNREAAERDRCTDRRVDGGRVEAVRRRLIDREEAVRLASLFRLLGDATRARMLFALLEAGELCVCDLAATVGAPETSVSHALRLLRTAGVTRARRDGRVIYYSLQDDHVRRLLDLSRAHVRHDGEARPARKRSRRRGQAPAKAAAVSGRRRGAR